ncbi:carbohydrate-binding family 6 protein [Chryseolinea sp. H1M3-3]|uniref:carbohydrate-binding family 6 protein n=1 Tax=Chryseolinea sp. H1M3-3 TaxID=3034144 RepID=UPI0023EB3746|nr:carbohydrate-binding family 6 protein [Chryseolinea sp. H1M3-3]
MLQRICFYLILCGSFTQVFGQQSVDIYYKESSEVAFAVVKISASLKQQGYEVKTNLKASQRAKGKGINIIFNKIGDTGWTKSITHVSPSVTSTIEPEGFNIQQNINEGVSNIFVSAQDQAGLMYGGLELAELIKFKGIPSITNIHQNPYMKKRGVKMNIPLDVRTPSYTDMSDAAQQNIPEMWSMEFWKEYMDSLASYRYNFVSLWSLHPFPSLIKVPEYPDVALDDVHRSKAKFQEYYSTRATGFDAPEIINNYEIVKKISIDEKIKFWQAVMQYGKERNIQFYIVTWNIYTCGTNGKYGITDDIKNDVTKDYFRKSIKQLFLTYPLLAGIGLTTGENMPGADFQAKEDWSFDTYAQGVIDVTKIQPERKITLIHRQHEAGALDIVKKFSPLIENKNINFVFSFKYAQAHVYSSTKQIHHHEFVKQIQETEKFKTLWTLRNDDVYYFRWGSPDFVRDFITNIPMDVTEGYYYGSDQYVWGREFLDKYPDTKRPIEIAKHWYQWMLWGRLGYNPTINNSLFINYLEQKYPETEAKKLFEAWHSASMIYPLTTGFHYGALDFQWYIEASKSRPEPAQTASGFHDVNRFITLPPYKATDFLSIPDYVQMKSANTSFTGTTPFEVAENINHSANDALRFATRVSPHDNDELFKTIEDIKAMAYLGKYYAHKINAATYLALFRKNEGNNHHVEMIDELNNAALYWRYYSSTALARYKNPLWTNRVGHVDWRDIYRYVIKDILDQQGEVHLPNMETTPGGTILEAEAAILENAKVSSETPGFTGEGYVFSSDSANKITLSYIAPTTGKYIIEFRYAWKPTVDISKNSFATITVNTNNGPSNDITFWPSGTAQNWVWDQIEVSFTKGEQRLSFTLPEEVQLDHVNVYRR